MDIKYNICLTSGFVGFDLENEDDLEGVSDNSLKDIKEQMIYWSMVIDKTLAERKSNEGK